MTIGKRIVGGHLGSAAGNPRTAWTGGAAPKDDAPVNASKEPLAAVIQRHHLNPPAGNPFAKTNNGWWASLSLGRLEKLNLQSDLETLQFAEKQVSRLQAEMTGIAAENAEIGCLLHIAPGSA